MKLSFAGLMCVLLIMTSPIAVYAEELPCCGSSINVTFPPELPYYRLSKFSEDCSSWDRSCYLSYMSPSFKPEGNSITLTVDNATYGIQRGNIQLLTNDGGIISAQCGTWDGDPCEEDLSLTETFYVDVLNPSYWAFTLTAFINPAPGTVDFVYWNITANLASELQGSIEFNPDKKGGPGENPNAPPWGGGDGPGQCPIGSPNYHVNTATLNLVVEDTDYAYDSIGQSVVLKRTWNADPSTTGMFGNGWDFSYASKIVSNCKGAMMTKGSGQAPYFRADLCPADGLSYPVSTTPPEGFYDSLVLTANNVWQYREKSTKRTFQYAFVSKDAGGFSTYRLAGITDRNGNALQIGYSGDGTMSYLEDSSGRRTTFGYDSLKKCTSIQTPDSRQASFTYDTGGNLITSVDLLGVASTYAYDGNNYLISLTVDDKTITFEYGTSGGWKHINSVTNAEGLRTQYFAWSNNYIEITDPRKGLSKYFNSGGKATQLENPAGNTVSMGYVNGLLVNSTDAKTNSTAMEYDARGNMTKKTDPLGKITTYAYDGDDNLITNTNPLGETWTYAYDGKSNLTSIQSPTGKATSFTYDTKGQLTGMTDANGNSTTFTYDSFGNRETKTDALGKTTTFGYDSAGINRTSARDPNGNASTFAYDQNRRLTRITHADGTHRDFSYDPCALTGVIDENGHGLSFSRDKTLRVIGITDAMNAVFANTYDGNGNRITTTDPLQRIVSMTYDAADRLATITDPAGGSVLFTRDANGNVTTLRNERLKQTAFTFDANDRTLSTTDPLGRVVSATRDDLGRLKQQTNARGALIGTAYDSEGRLTAKTYDAAIAATYSYDNAGNLTSFTDAGGTTTYTYNARNEVTGIGYPDGKAVTFAYDAAGNRVITNYPGGLTLTYGISDRNRIQTMQWDTSSVSFSYDAAGNLLSETRSNGTSAEYLYDANNRVTSIRHKKGTSAIASMDYTRNAVGNIINESATLPVVIRLTTRNDSGVYDDANQISTFGGSTYSYDADGNLTGISGNRTFTSAYDPKNRPVQMTSGGVTASYTYNALGNRGHAVRGTQATKYYHDHRGRLLFDADGSGNVLNYYLYTSGRLVAMRSEAGGSYFYHYEKNGNTVAITNESGNTVNAYAYTPSGEIAGSTETVANRFKYVGAYGVMDEGNGIYFMKNRYYDAVTGRFMQRDPIGFAGGQTNLYAYVRNNPVGRIDPSGKKDSIAGGPASLGDPPLPNPVLPKNNDYDLLLLLAKIAQTQDRERAQKKYDDLIDKGDLNDPDFFTKLEDLLKKYPGLHPGGGR